MSGRGDGTGEDHWTCGGCGFEGNGPDNVEWTEHTKVCPDLQRATPDAGDASEVEAVLLDALRSRTADTTWLNYDGVEVWLRAIESSGMRVGITDCCPVAAPCGRHMVTEVEVEALAETLCDTAHPRLRRESCIADRAAVSCPDCHTQALTILDSDWLRNREAAAATRAGKRIAQAIESTSEPCIHSMVTDGCFSCAIGHAARIARAYSLDTAPQEDS